MKTNKSLIIIGVSLIVALGVLSNAQEAHSSISNGGNYTTSMDPVSFYLYDLDNSHDAVLSADTLSFFTPANGSPPVLEYNINGSGWEGFSGPLSIPYGKADSVQISLRLYPMDDRYDNQSLTAGDITFQNYDAAKSDEVGLDLFQALYVVWDMNTHSTVTFGSANDPVTPNAPIPASALLLFTGLIGIIGFRRQLNNR
jgi:hypothetical protein